MFLFYTPQKTPENLWFSGVFGADKKRVLARNELRDLAKNFIIFLEVLQSRVTMFWTQILFQYKNTRVSGQIRQIRVVNNCINLVLWVFDQLGLFEVSLEMF